MTPPPRQTPSSRPPEVPTTSRATPPSPVAAGPLRAPLRSARGGASTPARPTLGWGRHGHAVVELQSLLNRRDEVPEGLVVDGIFGARTHTAVCQLQRVDPGLSEAGIVGSSTWEVLLASSSDAADPAVIARKLDLRGLRAYGQGAYGHAHDFFTAADEHEHAVERLRHRALSLEKLGGRREEAVALLVRYLVEGGAERAEARELLADLGGPGATGDEAVDVEAVRALHERGTACYAAGRYGHAYDEFTKAEEIRPCPQLTWNRAQSLRRLGGRREQAIALYERYLVDGGAKRAAEVQRHLDDLRVPNQSGREEVDAAAMEQLFERGAAAYAEADFGHAYDEFTRADQLRHDPALTFCRAQSLRSLGGRRAEAIDLYRLYLADGPAERAAEARFYLTELVEQGAVDPRRGL